MSARKKQSKPSPSSSLATPPAPRYDLDQIRDYARGRWAEILAALGGIDPDLLTGEHCACPRCGGTDRFRFSDLHSNGSAICNQCLKSAGDGFAVLQWMLAIKFAEAIALVANYLGIEPLSPSSSKSSSPRPSKSASGGKSGKPPGPTDPAESLEFQTWDEGSLLRLAVWCTWKPPTTPEAVLAAGGRFAVYQKQFDVIAIPVWGDDLLSPDAVPVGYSLYNITGGTLPRRAKNKETGRWETVEQLKVKLTHGSRPGLMCDRSRLQSSATMIKVEGPSDLLGLLSLPDLPADVCPITNANGCGERPASWMLDLIAGTNLVNPVDAPREACWVIHDADTPGQRGSIGYLDPETSDFRPGWANYLAPLIPTRNVALPFPIAESHGQDLRDYLTLGSTPDEPRVTPFADLLALAEESPILPAFDQPLPSAADQSAADSLANSPADSPAESEPPSSDTPALPLEEEDDPHFLARMNLARYAQLSNGGCIRYWREQFYTWKPSRACYKPISPPEFFAKVMSSVKDEFDNQWGEAYDRYRDWQKSASYDPDADKGPPKVRKVTAHLVKNVVAATASLTLIPSSIDLSTWLGDGDSASPTSSASSASSVISARERRPYIAMLNGIMDIDKAVSDADEADCITPHSPAWFSTVRLPYEFNIEATCPKWLTFLNRSLEGDQNRIDILQEWAGYCLTFDTCYQKFLAMEGEGGNGKSVFMAGLHAMLGAENCQHIGLERLVGGDYDIGETIGKLVNFCADVGEIDKLCEGNLKSFTSGDVVSAKRKFLSNLTAKPTAKLILSFNNRPRFSDRSQGVWRRMLLVPWRVQITATERVIGMDSAEWWQASGELPGMFNWALQGLWRLRMQKQFSYSPLVNEAIQDYQDESNPVRTFLRENFEIGSGTGFVRCADAYRFYVKWTIESGHRPMNERTFGKEFHRMFPSAERKKGGGRTNRFYYYNGIIFSQEEICGEKTPQENFLFGDEDPE